MVEPIPDITNAEAPQTNIVPPANPAAPQTNAVPPANPAAQTDAPEIAVKNPAPLVEPIRENKASEQVNTPEAAAPFPPVSPESDAEQEKKKKNAPNPMLELVDDMNAFVEQTNKQVTEIFKDKASQVWERIENTPAMQQLKSTINEAKEQLSESRIGKLVGKAVDAYDRLFNESKSDINSAVAKEREAMKLENNSAPTAPSDSAGGDQVPPPPEEKTDSKPTPTPSPAPSEDANKHQDVVNANTDGKETEVKLESPSNGDPISDSIEEIKNSDPENKIGQSHNNKDSPTEDLWDQPTRDRSNTMR